MDDDDDRREILSDVSGLLRDYFALGEWGRMLVELARDDAGELRIGDVQVEEIVGDERTVERAFGSREARSSVPAIGKAVEALLAIEGIDADAVGGGTFVRSREDSEVGPEVAFLAGLVKTPSGAFDAKRDEVAKATRVATRALRDELGVGAGSDLSVDNDTGTIAISRAGETIASGKHVVIGSFSRPHRSWAWAAYNPSLAPTARKRAASLLDEMPDRSSWEITTRGFATDEATAWALAGWVVHEQNLLAPVRIEVAGGFVCLGLLELQRR